MMGDPTDENMYETDCFNTVEDNGEMGGKCLAWKLNADGSRSDD